MRGCVGVGWADMLVWMRVEVVDLVCRLAWSSPRWAGFCRFSSNQNQCFVPPLRAHSMLRSSKVDGWIGLGKSYPTIYF